MPVPTGAVPAPAACLILLAASMAGAVERGGRGAREMAADDRCRCLADNRARALGERACIDMSDGPRLASCEMVSNVASRAIEAESCVLSRAAPSGPSPPDGLGVPRGPRPRRVRHAARVPGTAAPALHLAPRSMRASARRP